MKHQQKRIFRTILLGSLLAIFSGTVRGQSTFGTLLGTVKDASGAVIPKAKVVITNTDEGSSRTTTTNASGNYTLVDAKPGHYSVAVSKTGFESSQVTNLQLTSRQTLRADVTLRVGEVTQSVTVSGRAMGVITTDNSTISANYQKLQINNLPTNYRASANGNSPYYLLTILPGVQPDQNGNVSIQGGCRASHSSRWMASRPRTTLETVLCATHSRRQSHWLKCGFRAWALRPSTAIPPTSRPPPRVAPTCITAAGSGTTRTQLLTPSPLGPVQGPRKWPTTLGEAWEAQS